MSLLPAPRPARRPQKTPRAPFRTRPLLEQLEDRLTPSFLIPVSNHRALVFDATRDLLYITTSGGQVARFDPSSQTLLSAWNVGTSLNGADITPDGTSLYVAENQPGSTQGFIHKVDLSQGTVTDLGYNLAFGEGGAWDLAIGPNGKALFTTRFQGSGWTPLRQIDLATDTVSTRTDDPGSGGGGQVRQNTRVRRSADGSLFYLTESNISSGPLFTYDANADTFPTHANSDLFLDNRPAAVNRNGTLIAMQVGTAVAVMDNNFHAVENLSNADGGVAFDPVQDLVYVASTATNQVVAYDTNTWSEKFRLDVGERVTGASAFGNGEMVVSSDDQYLFLATTSGVRELQLPASTGVASSITLSGFPALISAGTPGTFTVTARDPAGNVATGYSGTVHFTSTDATASLPDDYTFTPDDQGVHTFTATLSAPGARSLTATDDGGLQSTQANISVHDQPLSLIPLSNRRDEVFDPTRQVLYITTGAGDVQRYDLATETLLAPWHVGNSLNGLDITPDGNFLYVAEGQRNVTQGFVRKVDLSSGAVTNLTYDRTSLESGSYDIAIGSNGIALFTTGFEGSGWTPLRQIDLSSDTLSTRTDDPGSGFNGQVRQNTQIQRGADRSLFFLTESNISSGPMFIYNAATDTFGAHGETSTFLDRSLSAVSPDGSLIALDLGGSVRVMDANLRTTQTLTNVHGGLAFDPTGGTLYALSSDGKQVVAFDTTTWTEQSRLNIGETVSSESAFGSGQLTLSDDGTLLFVATDSGVRILHLTS